MLRKLAPGVLDSVIKLRTQAAMCKCPAFDPAPVLLTLLYGTLADIDKENEF